MTHHISSSWHHVQLLYIQQWNGFEGNVILRPIVVRKEESLQGSGGFLNVCCVPDSLGCVMMPMMMMKMTLVCIRAAECGAESLSETPYNSHSEPVSFPAPHSSSNHQRSPKPHCLYCFNQMWVDWCDGIKIIWYECISLGLLLYPLFFNDKSEAVDGCEN